MIIPNSSDFWKIPILAVQIYEVQCDNFMHVYDVW